MIRTACAQLLTRIYSFYRLPARIQEQSLGLRSLGRSFRFRQFSVNHPVVGTNDPNAGGSTAAGVSAAGQAAVDDLVSYFAKHTERLGYYGRLQAGRSIGSGAVEGLARRLGDRLKTPGRGWRADPVDPMATLVNLVQTPEWPDLWKPAAN